MQEHIQAFFITAGLGLFALQAVSPGELMILLAVVYMTYCLS